MQMRVAGRASARVGGAEPPSGVKPKPFSASAAGGVAAALTTDERGRASQHGRKTGRENPRFQPPADPDTKPHSAHSAGNSGSGLTRNVGSTASVGNTAHLKHLESKWNAGLAEGGGGGADADGEVYKSGYSVDLMSTRELMELRRGIEATLDVRGVAPVSTCVPAAAGLSAARALCRAARVARCQWCHAASNRPICADPG